MCLKHKGIPSPISQGHKKAIISPRLWRYLLTEQWGLFQTVPGQWTQEERRWEKSKADLTMCRVVEKKERPFLVRLQVHLTKCRHEAQLVWTCDTLTWKEGLLYPLPTHLSHSFLYLYSSPFTPVHLRMQTCTSGPCSGAGRQRAVILKSLWQQYCRAPSQQQHWGQWQGPCCVLLLPLMSMLLTSWRRLSRGWLSRGWSCWQDHLQLSADLCAKKLRVESCKQHIDFLLIPQTSSPRTESYHPAP